MFLCKLVGYVKIIFHASFLKSEIVCQNKLPKLKLRFFKNIKAKLNFVDISGPDKVVNIKFRNMYLPHQSHVLIGHS